MTVRFVNEDGEESRVDMRSGEVTETRLRIRWDRIGGIVAAIVLIVMGWNVMWGMLDLLTEPLPPCTQATIQHVCGGAP